VAAAIDTSSAFGRRAERRLREEVIAWLVTVSRSGMPRPVPVWFLWEGESFLIYSRPDSPKVRNIERNPRVALHLDGNGRGGDIVVVTGEAAVSSDDPSADQVPAYVEKYRELIDRNGWTAHSFASDYSLPIRVRFGALHGH
jgi:PPOX class probable F420-dependent enzyme